MLEIVMASIISGLLAFILGHYLGVRQGMQRPKSIKEALSKAEEQDIIHLRARSGLSEDVCDLPMLIVGMSPAACRYHLYSSSSENACHVSRQIQQYSRNYKRIAACAYCFGDQSYKEPVW